MPRSTAQVTTEGVQVAVKVLRPGIEEEMARAIETYEWAAAHAEAMGRGACARLRPRLVIATFRQWIIARARPATREAASASELSADHMQAEPDFYVPTIDWKRTTRRVLTCSEWVDGTGLNPTATG